MNLEFCGIDSQKDGCMRKIKTIPLLTDAHGAALELGGSVMIALNSPPSFVSTPACMAARHTDENEA